MSLSSVLLRNMDNELLSPGSARKPRPQTASNHRQIGIRTKPLLSIPGRPQSASIHQLRHTKDTFVSAPQSPGTVWLRLFRPNSKEKASIHFVASHAGSTSQSRPNSTSPIGGVNPITLSKALRKRIHPQVTVNGYSLIRAFSRIRPYEASPPRTPKATDWSEQDLTHIANAQSLETFLRLMTGKTPRNRYEKKPFVPILSRQKVTKRREYCPLLDGRDYIDSHTKAEQEAREVMDSLYKRFGHSDPSPSSSQTFRAFPPGAGQPERADLAKEEEKRAVSEVGTVRVRPISAAVFRKNASLKASKKVAFGSLKKSVSARSSPRSQGKAASMRNPASLANQLLKGSFVV